MNLREVSRFLYLIKLTDQKTNLKFEKKGFSLTRYELLMALKDISPCSQNQLQEVLQIDQAAVTWHLKILEQKGYISRERNPKNNREIFVKLTEKVRNELATSEFKYEDLHELFYPLLEGDLKRLKGEEND